MKNRNGYWMCPKFYTLFAPDDGGGNGGGDGTPAGNDRADSADGAGNGADGAGSGDEGDKPIDNTPEALNAEIERLKAEMAKQKAAVDRATKEAAENKRALKEKEQALKAKMTAEEIAANEKKEAEEAQANRIAELEKQVARGETIKSVMGALPFDEETSGNFADCLYGAADIKNALLLFQKAWQAKEAQLKKEYGKITGPGAGADSNSPEAQAVKRAQEIGKARNAQNEQAQKAMNAYIR